MMSSSIERRARSISYAAIKSGRLIPAVRCERCTKKTKTDGHHPDYSKPLEVVWLCRRCHMLEDGRMKNLDLGRGIKQDPKKCSDCGRLSKPMRKGRCHSCDTYRSRTGKTRPYSQDGRIEKAQVRDKKPCKRCGRPAGIVGHSIKGFCKSCYMYLWRKS